MFSIEYVRLEYIDNFSNTVSTCSEASQIYDSGRYKIATVLVTITALVDVLVRYTIKAISVCYSLVVVTIHIHKYLAHNNNTSKQVTIKYFGKTSDINLEADEYRNDPKIIAFISAYAYAHKEKEKLIPKLQKEIFELCKKCNTDRLVNTYKEYSKLFNLVELYDKLLKPVLCKIGNLWKQGKLNVATEEIFIILL